MQTVKKVVSCRRLEGALHVPGDKSISHRALILNSIAQGTAEVRNMLRGADCLSTMACLRQLGAKFEEPPAEGAGRSESHEIPLRVLGVGLRGLEEAGDILDAGNSGTTMRLLTGLLSGQPFLSILTGDESLRSRPMGRVIKPLSLMGAQIWGRGDNSLSPLAIRGGNLNGIEYRLPVASAQLKSAVLLAALYAEGDTIVVEPSLSRDHTERLLGAMGVAIRTQGPSIRVSPPQAPLQPVDIDVPGDISSAAFWLVAGAIHSQARLLIRNVGVNPTRTGILEALARMGARVTRSDERLVGGEPVADLLVESSLLEGTEIRGEIIPRLVDEVPVLAVAACLAKGTTTIRDAGELRVKESDRIAGIAAGLRRLGASIEELPDGLVIRGPVRLVGAHCESLRDHRLAMAFAVAGLVAEGETTIADAAAVDISYPSFWEDLGRLSEAGDVVGQTR